MLANYSNHIDFSRRVELAVENGEPILALESTIITHGLPYPDNIQLARKLESIAQENNVVPATIAVINGRIKIGLSDDDFEPLGNPNASGANIVKASTRDLAFVIHKKLTAGTTVSATLFCAKHAKIKVFATGGIGGVHRGDAMDVSTDLLELSRTPIAVISAGAKAILDIPKTLEVLETFAIPVIGYQTQTFPTFYSRESTYPLNQSVKNLEELVDLLHIHWQLKLPSGILIANPILAADQIDQRITEAAIKKGLNEADAKNIRGKDLTPFLLQQIAAETQGQSVIANKQLIENNVKLGAYLARALNLEPIIK